MDIAQKKAEEPNASTIRPGEPECEAAYQTISGPVGDAIASMLGGLSRLETVLFDFFLTVNGVDGGCMEQGRGNSVGNDLCTPSTTCQRVYNIIILYPSQTAVCCQPIF